MSKRSAFSCIELCVVLLSLTLLQLACDTSQTKYAAPLGSEDSLQKLADAYTKVSEQLNTSPVSLNPKGRKKFVIEVFHQAGYDYTATLVALSHIDSADVTKSHRDLRDLLFLPHYRYNLEDVNDIYTTEEFGAVEKLLRNW